VREKIISNEITIPYSYQFPDLNVTLYAEREEVNVYNGKKMDEFVESYRGIMKKVETLDQ